ncbi:type II CRISPR RNA-guided endonuclease Cas9 [Amorphus sp. 3PC139-8]|uniref:type II CRISPR RNA-guided endonuclease Cas9 n=1 Tax=Amorphus sp. 3PC139-8 TaxID=2735676 RepID=UPI00345D3F31
MARFEAEGGYLARHLTDTQHMSRLAGDYLKLVCERVYVSPGKLTAMLRAKWRLNTLPGHNYTDVNQPKNRKDHRHHAVDAFVLACTDRGLLNRISREAGRAEDLQLDRLFPPDSFPEPFPGFREELMRHLETVVVSHKSDHGLPVGAQDDVHVTSGQLHEGTAYGLVDEEIDGKRYNLVYRKPIDTLTKGEIDRVRDADLREALREVAYAAKRDDVKLPKALAEFGRTRRVGGELRPIHRVRLLKTKQSVRVVEHGASYAKAYVSGGNHRVEIYELAGGEWLGEGVSVYDANRPGYRPGWPGDHPGARLVMRVHNGDLIEADFGEGRQIMRIYGLEPIARRLRLAPHEAAGRIDERHEDPDDPLRWTFATYARLKKAGARKVYVDPIGRVFRTGRS